MIHVTPIMNAVQETIVIQIQNVHKIQLIAVLMDKLGEITINVKHATPRKNAAQETIVPLIQDVHKTQLIAALMDKLGKIMFSVLHVNLPKNAAREITTEITKISAHATLLIFAVMAITLFQILQIVNAHLILPAAKEILSQQTDSAVIKVKVNAVMVTHTLQT